MKAELASLDAIRVETVLSRFPIHRLAKLGTVPIEIRETTAAGELALRWEVSHNSRYGQPGPLGYKIDTLVVSRKLEVPGAGSFGPRRGHFRSLGGNFRSLGGELSVPRGGTFGPSGGNFRSLWGELSVPISSFDFDLSCFTTTFYETVPRP